MSRAKARTRDISHLIPGNKRIYTDYFDPDYPEPLVRKVINLLSDLYFRTRFIGFENLPQRNNPEHPIILASNHSGMAFPWDAIIFTSGYFRLNRYIMNNAVRVLTSPMLSDSTLMNPFLIKNFWLRAGAIDATFLNFETMMHYPDSNLMIYPEGVPGIGKPFSQRYQLQRYSSSFIRMSIKYKVDVVPVATVNGEYINPWNTRFGWLNRLVQKIGIPFLPIGFMTLLIPLQPWLFYFAFPARLTYVLGKPIKPYEMVDKPWDELTDEEFRAVTEKVKAMMQQQLDAAVQAHGSKPYDVLHLLKTWLKNLRYFPFYTPCFWPALFAEFDRCYRSGRPEKFTHSWKTYLRSLVHNPITIAFFIPILGWVPILLRGLRNRRQLRRERADAATTG